MAICNIQSMHGPSVNQFVRLDNKTGMFSVKSAYLCNQKERFGDAQSRIWKLIGSMKIHERLRVFFWRLYARALTVLLDMPNLTSQFSTLKIV